MDLLETLEATGTQFRPGRDETELWLCCPFCLEEGQLSVDTRFRLGLNLVDGRMSCFNCGKRGRGDYTLDEFKRVLQVDDIKIAKSNGHKQEKPEVNLPEDFELVSPNSKEYWAKKAYKYLHGRGIPDWQIEDKKIGFSVSGFMAYRIVFPVYHRHKLHGLVGRDFTEEQDPPYKNSIGEKTLYNVPHRNHGKAICLSEGIPDALAIERASRKLGIDSAGLLGKTLEEKQLKLLEPYKTILLWLDPDAEGVRGTLSIRKQIPRDKVLRVVLPEGFKHSGAKDSDPDELETTRVTHRLAKAELLTPELGNRLQAWAAFKEDD